VRDIRRATRRQYSAEEKVRIVTAGLRGEDGIAELCRKEGINQNLYYRWSKDFLEAGKKRLAGDTAREGDQRRSEGAARRDSPAQGVVGRADAGEPPAQKTRARGWGGRYMRYAAAEKLEIIRLVEQSSLSVRRALAKLGIPRSTLLLLVLSLSSPPR
jgi:putative transposase